MAGEIEKMGNGQVASILASGGYILAVTMVDKDGVPVVIGAGESGGSVQLKQGESDVSSTNPLPIGLYSKNIFGDWELVSAFNPIYTRDQAIQGALVNQGSDPNNGQMVLVAGAGFGGARMIPVNLSGQDDTMTLIPVGGVDENGKQKTLNFNGDRAKVELQNANGAFSESNPLDTQNATIGKKDDAAATSDTATSSLISLFKRLLGKFASLGQKTKSGSMPVVIASDQDALPTTSTQFPSSLGQKLKAQSLAVTLPLDQIVPVQTDERPSSYCVAITPSNTVGFGGTSRGIYIGVSGDVSAFIGGASVVFKNCMAGTILPVQATRVDATNTTATNLIALF